MTTQLSLNVWVERRNLATLSALHSVHDTGRSSDIMILFRVSQNWGGGGEVMVINVKEINALLN